MSYRLTRAKSFVYIVKVCVEVVKSGTTKFLLVVETSLPELISQSSKTRGKQAGSASVVIKVSGQEIT